MIDLRFAQPPAVITSKNSMFRSDKKVHFAVSAICNETSGEGDSLKQSEC